VTDTVTTVVATTNCQTTMSYFLHIFVLFVQAA